MQWQNRAIKNKMKGKISKFIGLGLCMGPPEENLILGSDPAVLSSTYSLSIQHSHIAHRSADYCPPITLRQDPVLSIIYSVNSPVFLFLLYRYLIPKC